MTLAHWTYTKEEWRNFTRCSFKKQKGFFPWIFGLFLFIKDRKIPEVRITAEKVSIGNDHQHFSSEQCCIKEIDIREERNGNVLMIAYRQRSNHSKINEIRVPVPKGKLREAIQVQEHLYQTKKIAAPLFH